MKRAVIGGVVVVMIVIIVDIASKQNKTGDDQHPNIQDLSKTPTEYRRNHAIYNY
jgi:hypothetical protein|tara:strand:+ start:3516 stop:3680 length:165 start_codon:yes stop_codon:yes gene_type:complete